MRLFIEKILIAEIPKHNIKIIVKSTPIVVLLESLLSLFSLRMLMILLKKFPSKKFVLSQFSSIISFIFSLPVLFITKV